MESWAISMLIKVALPIVLKWLQDSGAITDVEVWGIKTGTHVLQAVKVEDSYPTDTALRGNNISTPQ